MVILILLYLKLVVLFQIQQYFDISSKNSQLLDAKNKTNEIFEIAFNARRHS